MMAENVSPEEKLFRIIQQEKTAPPAPGRTGAPGKNNFLLWKEKAVSVIKNLAGKFAAAFPDKPRELELKTANIVLAVLLLAVISFVIYYAVAKYPSPAKTVMAAAAARNSLARAHNDIEELHAAGYYTDDARKRNIFSSAAKPAAMGPEMPVGASSKSLATELKVQGISWGDVPKVMLQGDKDSKFYILKEGQPVGSTGIRVKTILKNKVILTNGDKDVEL